MCARLRYFGLIFEMIGKKYIHTIEIEIYKDVFIYEMRDPGDPSLGDTMYEYNNCCVIKCTDKNKTNIVEREHHHL